MFAKRGAAVIVPMWTATIWAARNPSASPRGPMPFTTLSTKFDSRSFTLLDVPRFANCEISLLKKARREKRAHQVVRRYRAKGTVSQWESVPPGKGRSSR
jgi:hypothetical protein